MHWFKNSLLRLHGLEVKLSVPETPSKPLPSHSLTLIPAFLPTALLHEAPISASS